MNAIFEEIVGENNEIRQAKEKIQNGAGGENTQAKMKVGKMVEEALKKKKEQEAEKISRCIKKNKPLNINLNKNQRRRDVCK